MWKFDDLDQEHKVRELLLETKSETSLLYFKVIKLLGLFLDSVRAAPKYLDSLCLNVPRRISSLDVWGEKELLSSTESRRILSKNWDIVREKQQESTDKLVVKLNQTKEEVQSLLDGVSCFCTGSGKLIRTDARFVQQFQVQSITEAQKSRELNNYLFVFTVFTILFLPPTFVVVCVLRPMS